MILALYVIGSAIALIVLAVKLRDTREALRQMIRNATPTPSSSKPGPSSPPTPAGGQNE